MDRLTFDRKALKAFGITMGAVLLTIGVIILIRHRRDITAVAALSAIFFASALFYPDLLKPAYAAWMRFAFILSWVNTRIILCLIFYLVFTPIGIVLRIFGNDLLKRKMDREAPSYWKDADKIIFNRESYEKQF